MSEAFPKFVPNFEAVIEFHKANLEALVQVQSVLAKGVQEISKELIAQTQAQLEALAYTGKSALAAKTLQEVVELNVDGAKTGYEKIVNGTTRLSELGVQVANDAFAPIKARAAAAAETLKVHAA
jgi:phasin family protein